MTSLVLPERGVGQVAVVAAAAAVAVAAGGLLASPLLGVTAFIAALMAATAIALRPDWLVVVVVALLYSNAAAVAVRVHHMPRAVGLAIPFLLFVPIAVRLTVRREAVVLPPALPWLIGFLVVQLIGTLFSVDRERATDALYTYILEGLVIYVAVVNAVRSRELLRACLWGILTIGAALSAVVLHQSVTDNYHDDYLGFAQIQERALERLTRADEGVLARSAGPIGEKNYFAQILVALVPIGLLRLREQRSAPTKAAAAALTALVIGGITVTQSRGGALALGATLVAMVLLRHLRSLHIGLVAAALVVVVTLSPGYTDRFAVIAGSDRAELSDSQLAAGGDVAVQGRLGEMLAAIRVFSAHPVIGVGPSLFPLYYREQAIEVGLLVHENTRAAHSFPAQLAAETGILGVVALGGAIVVTLKHLLAGSRRSRRDDASLAGSVMFALVAYLCAGFFLSLAYARYFWFLLALGAVAANVTKDHEPAEGDG